MGPCWRNPWLQRSAPGDPARLPPQAAYAAPADPLGEVEATAAAAWASWTPRKSAADEFQARLAAYVLSYYRRRAAG